MNHQGTPVLHTTRLTLRPFRHSDAADMYANWASDPEVTKYLTWPAHTDIQVSESVLNDWIPHYVESDYYHWAITYQEHAIGSMAVVQHDDTVGKAHIGYCIGQKWWHQGIVSEALKCVMEFLFVEVGYQRLEARHDPRNPHSGAVMRKCGMKYEGTLRQSDWNNQGVCDACWYAILKSER